MGIYNEVSNLSLIVSLRTNRSLFENKLAGFLMIFLMSKLSSIIVVLQANYKNKKSKHI